MGVKSQVFASQSEKVNFYKLMRQWGERYHIYHNLPFLNVFTVDSFAYPSRGSSNPLIITDIESSRLKKTSIDYTLCDTEEKPILCIEFDGLQQGFNLGTTYHPSEGFDEWRRQITELKLRVAHSNAFPYFVVSSEHFRDLTDDIQLTIVDGIIGDVLAQEDFNPRFQSFSPSDYGYSSDEFDLLSREEQQDIIENWGIHAEVDAQMENNPIYRKAAELQGELIIAKVFPQVSYGGAVYPPNTGINEAISRGCKCKVHSEKYGDIERTILLPNFKNPKLDIRGVATAIAELLVFREFKQRVDSSSYGK